MTRDDLHDCLLIIQYHITPETGGWKEQPLGVGTWLNPVQLCLDQISKERSKQ